jgi:hypothetical protein
VPRVPCDWVGLRSTGKARKVRVTLETAPAAGLVEQGGVYLERSPRTVWLSDVLTPGSPEWEAHLDAKAAEIRERYGLNEDMLTGHESYCRGGPKGELPRPKQHKRPGRPRKT